MGRNMWLFDTSRTGEYDCGGGGVDACMAGWMEVYVYMYVFM